MGGGRPQAEGGGRVNDRQRLWPIEPLTGAQRHPASRHHGFRLRPLWDWNWRRIGECIGLPLLFLLAWIIVGWGGQP